MNILVIIALDTVGN